MRTSSMRWCRSPTCSVTSTPCAPCPKGAPPSPCSSATTRKPPRTCRPKCSRNSLNSKVLNGESDGKREIQSYQAALQYRHDRPRRPWQDDVDRGDHQGSVRDGRRDLHRLRPDRQGAGREGARHHHLDRARRSEERRVG